MSFINSFVGLIDSGDHLLFQIIYNVRNEWLTKVFLSITDLGGEIVVPFISLVLILSMWYWKKRRDLILPFIVTMAGAIGTSEVLKHFIQRARPDAIFQVVNETGFSFPSIHATAAMALYGFFIYFAFKESENATDRRLIVIFGNILIALIGFSRVYIGVHYPTDVLAGYIVAFVWLFIGIHLKHYLKHRLPV